MKNPLTIEQQLLQIDHVCDAIDDGTPQRADIIANIRSSLRLNMDYVAGRELTPEEQKEVEQDIEIISQKIDYMAAHNYTGSNMELNIILKNKP